MTFGFGRSSALALTCLTFSSAALAQSIGATEPNDPAGVVRLVSETGGASVRINSATGTARFVRVPKIDSAAARGTQRSAPAVAPASVEQASTAFLQKYAGVFG